MEQTAKLHSSRASAPWIQFSGWCPKLWGFVFLQACFVTPLCLAIHIPCTHLWEKIICLHQKQLLHHPKHVSPFTRRGSLILNPSNTPRTRLALFRFTSCTFLHTKGQKIAPMTLETCSSVPGQLHFACNWMVLWRHVAFYADEEPKEGCLNNLLIFCLAPAKKKWQ